MGKTVAVEAMGEFIVTGVLEPLPGKSDTIPKSV
jgi:hypothetical protein